jgi:hypothetical protein
MEEAEPVLPPPLTQPLHPTPSSERRSFFVELGKDGCPLLPPPVHTGLDAHVDSVLWFSLVVLVACIARVVAIYL